MGTYSWRTPTSRAEKIERYRASHARIMAGEGFIYVAKVARRPLVKIGFSLNPEHRVLQAAQPFYRKLKLLAKVPGSIREEQAMHRALTGLSAGGHSEVYPISILSHPAIPAGLRGSLT